MGYLLCICNPIQKYNIYIKYKTNSNIIYILIATDYIFIISDLYMDYILFIEASTNNRMKFIISIGVIKLRK